MFIEYINATNAKTFSFQIFTLSIHTEIHTHIPLLRNLLKKIFLIFFFNKEFLKDYHVTV